MENLIDAKVTQKAGEISGQGKMIGINIEEFKANFSYFQARPKDLSRSFDSYMADRTKAFVGRNFVFEELDAFLDDPSQGSGYFVIKGEPGIGKSSLMAYLVGTRGYIHHFNIALQNIVKSKRFMENVTAQIISKYDLPSPRWSEAEKEEALKDGAFLNRTLEDAAGKLEDDEKLVVAIDALDEVDIGDLPSRANVLYLPPSLPKNVYFVVSTRPKHDIRLDVLNSRVLEVAAGSADNLQDARLYIDAQASDKAIRERIGEWKVTRKQFAETLLEKSEGNFMYLYHVLPAVKAGWFSTGKLDELPNGLIGYYRSHWRQMRIADEEKFEKYYQPVVCVLAAVREAVLIRQISNFTNIEPGKIRDVIRQWREFLDEESNRDKEKIYRIYHKSFQDFLSDEVDPGLKTYNAMIARYYLKLAGMDK